MKSPLSPHDAAGAGQRARPFAERVLSAEVAIAVGLLLPAMAFAEVSDKTTATSEMWGIGCAAAILCFLGAYLRPWSLLLLVPLPTFWFVSLLVEIHFSDISAALYDEVGAAYYVQAHASWGLWVLGTLVGWVLGKRRTRASTP